MNTDLIPNIGSGKADAQPLANFLRKEKTIVPVEVMASVRIQIPPLYYWETVESGVSILMTAAFQWHGKNYGESFAIEEGDNVGRMRRQLFTKVKQTMDVLIHHGEKILDNSGNINPKLVYDQEAIRYKFDPLWDKKVAAFNKLVRVAPITRKKAVKLGLLPQPKI